MDGRHMLSADRGFTLLEVVVSAALAALIAGGTMIAFVTALNISHRASGTTKAAHLAQQTMERFRNRIACDDSWFDPATCAAAASTGLPTAWTSNPVLPPATPPITREYRITPDECDGVATTPTNPPDCYRVQTRVSWTPPS